MTTGPLREPTATPMIATVEIQACAEVGPRLRWISPDGSWRPIPETDLRRIDRLNQALAEQERRYNRSGVPSPRRSLGRALFDLIDGPDRTLSATLEAAQSSGEELDLLRFRRRLAALDSGGFQGPPFVGHG